MFGAAFNLNPNYIQIQELNLDKLEVYRDALTWLLCKQEKRS